jgi:transposase-like protein
MNKPTYTRRSQQQWQNIINDFTESGLSGAQFCKQNDIRYASFSKWRKRLTQNRNPLEQSASSFIDLGQLTDNTDASSWHITLKLGNGIELVLSQR